VNESLLERASVVLELLYDSFPERLNSTAHPSQRGIRLGANRIGELVIFVTMSPVMLHTSADLSTPWLRKSAASP
jgi:hypothetical protein